MNASLKTVDITTLTQNTQRQPPIVLALLNVALIASRGGNTVSTLKAIKPGLLVHGEPMRGGKLTHNRWRETWHLSVRCAMCGHNAIVKWVGGKGGVNPPELWLCLDHEVHIR